MKKDFVYIGSLSVQDAIILYELSQNKNKILEFGSGASTQIFAQQNTNNYICSIDTKKEWLNVTKDFIKNELLINKDIDFLEYKNKETIKEKFDLIYNDGFAPKRLDFALWSWNKLSSNKGLYLLHDGKRPGEINILCTLLNKYSNEISNIKVNPNKSNIICIEKKMPEPYQNWNEVEKRESWMQSLMQKNRPSNWKEIIKNKIKTCGF